MKKRQFYDNDGEPVSDTKARRIVRDDCWIHDPNRCGHSEVARRLGFKILAVEDWTSSAGDWSFRIRGGLLIQENRYPLAGFRYCIARRFDDGMGWKGKEIYETQKEPQDQGFLRI